ncbi:hypothetical protein C1H46_006759 [Malus baccata]|uniref:Uncharacterized protein n=1 Tax=Malus baccata TaxID=106549 RepID=A0A540N994_MALBA|nr:hypothetical protein C1H46_006759 [Malus baccata]
MSMPPILLLSRKAPVTSRGSSKAGNRDWISRFMVFTSGVCGIAGSWSPELASTAARELSS